MLRSNTLELSATLADIVDRLQQRGLIPPVKSVESGRGGGVRIVITGSYDERLAMRIRQALAGSHAVLEWMHRSGPAVPHRRRAILTVLASRP